MLFVRLVRGAAGRAECRDADSAGTSPQPPRLFACAASHWPPAGRARRANLSASRGAGRSRLRWPTRALGWFACSVASGAPGLRCGLLARAAPLAHRSLPSAAVAECYNGKPSASRANQCESRVRGRLGVRGAPRYRFWDIRRQRRPQASAAASASMTGHPVGPCVDQNLRPEQAPCIGRWTGHGLVKRCRGTEVRLARPKVRRGMRGARAGHGDRNPNQTQTHS